MAISKKNDVENLYEVRAEVLGRWEREKKRRRDAKRVKGRVALHPLEFDGEESRGVTLTCSLRRRPVLLIFKRRKQFQPWTRMVTTGVSVGNSGDLTVEG